MGVYTLLRKTCTYIDKIFALLFKYMTFIKAIKDVEKFFSSEGTGYLSPVHRSTLEQQSQTILVRYESDLRQCSVFFLTSNFRLNLTRRPYATSHV